ncbi:hypothetical protein PoB_002487800 [Plakobranchus ocellatus]|uniref:Uncharacterized protein n=1 Tax=Plakobranchus ocellatus TaxID=259542 RepID=A0AAV3ZU26_9GAST|nr:hypothetical protein PoB_002487800 [Plakobranchus ocellatus]
MSGVWEGRVLYVVHLTLTLQGDLKLSGPFPTTEWIAVRDVTGLNGQSTCNFHILLSEQGDLRLLNPPSDQSTDGGARTCVRRSLQIAGRIRYPPTPLA